MPKTTLSTSPLLSFDNKEEVDPSNVGWGLMNRMGQTPGHGLGKEEQGRRRPIENDTNIGMFGLGYQFIIADTAPLKWKLWNHFVQGPTEGGDSEPLEGDPEEDIPSLENELQENEGEDSDFGLARLFYTPDDGSLLSISVNPDHTPFIPADGLHTSKSLMLAVIDHVHLQKKM